jgi:hypothetical protein
LSTHARIDQFAGGCKDQDQHEFAGDLSAGSHLFQSRALKLCLLEPMVLRGKLPRRVGTPRDYSKIRSLFKLNGFFVELAIAERLTDLSSFDI